MDVRVVVGGERLLHGSQRKSARPVVANLEVAGDRPRRLDVQMVSRRRPAPDVGRSFPDGVPVLLDPAHGVTLRAPAPADTTDLVEACRDPETTRWTTVPVPDGGYGPGDAQAFLEVVAAGWASGERLTWAIEAERDGRPRFCGSIHLVRGDLGQSEVGFLLHPAARRRGLMTWALRLVRDHVFDVLGWQAVHWRCRPGHWASRRVAARAGFIFDGTVRQSLPHRDSLSDAWTATIVADDPRASLIWPDPPELSDPRMRLRPFADADADRIMTACADPRTRHWLRSIPQPYARADALDYLEQTREHAAQRTGWFWCIADPDDDRYLGAISLEGLGGYARRAEIGYLAHPEARGAGVVSAAVRLVTAYAEQHLVDGLLIRCAAGNHASRHVALAAGYAEAGVLPRCEPVGPDAKLDDLVLYSRP